MPGDDPEEAPGGPVGPSASSDGWVDIYEIQSQGDPWYLTLFVILLASLPPAIALGAYLGKAIPERPVAVESIAVIAVLLEGTALALYPRMRVRQLTRPEAVRLGKSSVHLILSFPRKRRNIPFLDIDSVDRIEVLDPEEPAEEGDAPAPPARVHWRDGSHVRTFQVPQPLARALQSRLEKRVKGGTVREDKEEGGRTWSSWTAHADPPEEKPSGNVD